MQSEFKNFFLVNADAISSSQTFAISYCFFAEDRRALTEPPVPGYCGYIPRIKTTEQGLGARYHMSTKNGLELFAQETASASQRLTGQVPASLDRSVGQGQSVKVWVQVLVNQTPSFRRSWTKWKFIFVRRPKTVHICIYFVYLMFHLQLIQKRYDSG